MILTSPASTYRLTVLGYQYPDAGEPYDANWLSIQVDVASPEGQWSGTDACLLTYEAVRLADWLDGLAQGKPVPRALSFLEPVLLFRLVDVDDGTKVLRAHFGNIVHPAWREAGQGPNDLSVDFPASDALMLRTAAGELRQELRRFPQRGEQ